MEYGKVFILFYEHVFMKAILNLIVLESGDVERLRRFYESNFGIIFDKHTDHGPIHYGTSLGGVYLELYSSKHALSATDHIGFEVESIDALLRKLTDNQQRIHRLPVQTPFGRYAIILDSDGRKVHLSEHR